MRKPAADGPQDLPPYKCKSHGPVEPLVSYRSNGYLHRRCPLCLKERFDKRAWQRERRALLRQNLPPKGRVYAPRASTLEDMPPYECGRHGRTEPLVTKTRSGHFRRRCSICWGATDDEFSKGWRAKKAEYMRGWNREQRRIALERYGGKCACCGESNFGFLSIDHVNNDGKRHRREDRQAASIYVWLRLANYPTDGFQILCYSCNLGKAFNGGICPHLETKL